MQKLLVFLLFFISVYSYAQKMSISGNVQDTATKVPVKNAVAMVIRIKDSILVAHTRTDEKGHFTFNNLKIDTVQVIITEPRFGDQSYYVFGSASNYEFDFGKIVLPPKSKQLNEVVIYAYRSSLL